jgi:prenyltransferase beta subunit
MENAFQRKILDFISARRHKTGGFGAAPTLPPSIEDTYLSLRILRFLRPHLDNEVNSLMHHPSLVHYLVDPQEGEEWYARTWYHYVYCCRTVGAELNREAISRFLVHRSKGAMFLADRFYCSRMLKELPDTYPAIRALSLKAQLSFRWRTAKELWMVLHLAEGDHEKLQTGRNDILSWVRACQNPDGGFGFLPGTTSFMENVHTCLRVLALLKAPPPNPGGARRFILSAWTRSGGFARKNGGAPFLDATWHAVGSLSILEKNIKIS